MQRLRVGIIYGGRSGEHEVSLASAAAVCKNLDPDRYDAVPILIQKDGRWTLPSAPPALEAAADAIAAAKTPIKQCIVWAAGPSWRSLPSTRRRRSLAIGPGSKSLFDGWGPESS